MPTDNDWYDELGDDWWDPRGPVAALHDFNSARTTYANGVIRAALPDIAEPRVLDVGAGGGLFSASLAKAGFEVIGLDASVPSLQTARKHTGGSQNGDHQNGHSQNGGGAMPAAPSYVAGNAMLLPFADGSFDAAVCSEVIEHVASPAVLFNEVARVLRPGGVLCFDTPNRTWYARVALISIAENLGWAPRGTHDYSQFQTSDDLRDHAADAGLHLRDLRGISLERSALGAMFGYLRRRSIGGFRLSDDLRFVITGYFEKPKPPELTRVGKAPIAVGRDAR